MSNKAPAVVACCSKAGLAIVRALGARGVRVAGVAYGVGQIASFSRYMHDHVRCPDPAEGETGFLAALDRLAEKPQWRGAVLFPSDDSSLVAISRHKTRLSERFHVVAQDWCIVQRLIEKQRTYEIAQDAGVLYPRLSVVRSPAEAIAMARETGYPCLVKPCVGHLFFKRFGRKMLMPGSEAELEEALRQTASFDGDLMLCEFIPGPDTCGANYNSFCVEGRPLVEFTAQKIRIKPRSIGFPTAVRSRHIPEVLEAGRRMAAALRIDGFSCMEFKRDVRDGRYRLMEVNARHNYSGSLATACGIDFPWMSYQAAQGLSIDGVPARALHEVCWIDEERDAVGALRALARGPRELRAYVEPCKGRRVYAVSSRSDPKPSLRLFAGSLTRALRRLGRPRAHGETRARKARADVADVDGWEKQT